MHILQQIKPHLCLGILDLEAFAAQRDVKGKRETETSGTQYLLEKMLNGDSFTLSYTPENQPLLPGKHISISHSHGRLAIVLNANEPTGVDIELIREKVKKVEHKFLNEPERALASGDICSLTAFWGVKEALYKLYGKKNLDFKEHMFIESYIEGRIQARINAPGFNTKYELACEKRDNYMLVYVLNEV